MDLLLPTRRNIALQHTFRTYLTTARRSDIIRAYKYHADSDCLLSAITHNVILYVFLKDFQC